MIHVLYEFVYEFLNPLGHEFKVALDVIIYAGFVVLLSPGSLQVVNQIVTDDNNKMNDDNKRPFWRFLLHFWCGFGRFSCKNERFCSKNAVVFMKIFKPSIPKYKLFVSEVQGICTSDTTPLYY